MTDLTTEQNAAVILEGGNIATVANPGSGKTRVLVARISYDIGTGKSEPATTAVITFTAAAAGELVKRLAAENVPALDYVGTLHGYCLRILNRHRAAGGLKPYQVVDEETATALADWCIAEYRCKGVTASKLADTIALMNTHTGEPRDHNLSMAVKAYRRLMATEGVMDYNLILREVLDMLSLHDPGTRSLYVDEFQDSAAIDFAIYQALPLTLRFVVGDPDQAIYGFRGGQVGNLLEFMNRDGTAVAFLETNFRSGRRICCVADNLIGFNTIRASKRMHPANTHSGDVTVNEYANAGAERAGILSEITTYMNLTEGAEFKDCAVLVRTNAERKAIVDELNGHGVPVANQRPELPKDWPLASACLACLAQPDNFLTAVAWHRHAGNDMATAMRTVRLYQSRGEAFSIWSAVRMENKGDSWDGGLAPWLTGAGITRETVFRINDLVNDLAEGHGRPPTIQELSYAMREAARPGKLGAGVVVTTMHGAKGLEWPVVFLPAMEQETFPGKKRDSELEEERRLMFVAVTRAKQALHISYAKTRPSPYGRKQSEPRTPSQFIQELK